MGDLYNATNGKHWQWLTPSAIEGYPWVFSPTANPCEDNWQGVTCALSKPSMSTYVVTILKLTSKALSGQLPASLYNFGTVLVSLIFYEYPFRNSAANVNSFVLIGSLTKLLLADNDLSGTIPSSLGQLSLLEGLELSQNSRLNGTIPSTFASLTHLTEFIASSANLSGSISSSLLGLPRLNKLKLNFNRFTGTLSESTTGIAYLELRANLLYGTVPQSIAEISNLVYLDLSSNAFSGSLPESLWNNSALNVAYFQNNRLQGSISNTIGAATGLAMLNMSSNVFMGTIPVSVGFLQEIEQLDLSNNRIIGTIPVELGRISSMLELDLSNNILTGSVPSPLRNMTSLQTLCLQGNRLNGQLANLFDTSQVSLVTIQLDGNEFTGELPPSVFQLPNLKSLSLANSCLSGTLPFNVCNSTQLEALILYGLSRGDSCRATGLRVLANRGVAFGGGIPSCLFSLPSLSTLLLSSNNFQGSFEDSIVVGAKLRTLDLSHNQLTGSIPASLQNVSWSLLDLSHNKFVGELSSALLGANRIIAGRNRSAVATVNFTNHTDAVVLTLDGNRLSGIVPRSIASVLNLSVLAGNLFQCRYDKDDLPQYDSDLSTYQCASNSFDVAVFAWLGLLLLALVVIALVLKFWPHYGHSVLSLPVVELTDIMSVRLLNLSSVNSVLQIIQNTAWFCALFSLILLLPFYIVVSHYYGTHTYQYAYILSGIYASGVATFSVSFLLWVTLIAALYSTVYMHPTAVEVLHDLAPHEWRARCYVWIIFTSISVSVVSGVNVAFIYIVLSQSSDAQTAAQIALSLFKLGWSMAVSPRLIRRLDLYCLPRRKVHTEPFFTLQLLVALFNHIAIPCLVVMAIDPNCFCGILSPPSSQSVDYFLPVCDNAVVTCGSVSLRPSTLQVTPPFTYSYQCSASFITSYAPTFIYMSVTTVFVHPLTQYLLMQIHERLAVHESTRRMISILVPRVLLTPSADFSRSIDVRKQSSLVDVVGTLITVLTHLGILFTFGVLFPPVALAMAVSISATIYQTRYKVQRLLRAAVDAQLMMYLDLIDADCQGVGTSDQMQLAVKIIVCYCYAFYTLFLFDALGDTEGFNASAWILFVVPLAPFAVFSLFRITDRCSANYSAQGRDGNTVRDGVEMRATVDFCVNESKGDKPGVEIKSVLHNCSNVV